MKIACFLVLCICNISRITALQGDNLGCYQFSSEVWTRLADSRSSADTVDSCIDQCRRMFYRYAGLLNGEQCYCGSFYEATVNNDCAIKCRGNSTQLCGGSSSVSVYETGIIVAGPPRSVSLLSHMDNGLKISWEPPEAPNGVIRDYTVMASPTSSYSLSTFLTASEFTFPNNSRQGDLTNLHPGTQYNVTVRAKTLDGQGVAAFAVFTTDIGAPDVPEAPLIVSSLTGQATLRLKPVLPSKGPVSSYRVIVINEDASSTAIDSTRLRGAREAKAQGIPYYVAAELKPDEFKQEFTVGDGRMYNGFLNAPLPDDRDVLFILGVVSTYEGVSKSSHSAPSTPVANVEPEESLPPPPPVPAVPDDGSKVPVIEEETQENGSRIPGFDDDRSAITIPPRRQSTVYPRRSESGRRRPYKDPPPLVVGLSVAVGILAFVLVICIAVYFYLRHRVHRSDLNRRRRRPSDRQGLTMFSGSTSTIELENGYVHSSYVMGIDETPIDYYDSLKQRMWSIPSDRITKSHEVLGTGQYGTVKKASVSREQRVIEVALHFIEDKNFAAGQKQAMLKDLGVLVKVGQHANIAGIVGVCDDPDVVLLAMENYGTSLKELLLNSRALNNYPSYAEKEQRICTLHEAQAIDMALGIARGMSYLQSVGVPHKRLAARTVLICDGSTPKLFGFGMDFYQSAGQSWDFKRWIAPEALGSLQHAPKCEVWSFAVVLWEIFTLGATPYAEVRTKELVQRVQRGLRLPQPSNVTLSAYQLLMTCWQVDLDERPTFEGIIDMLQEMFNHALDYLSFNLSPGFQYEKYDPAIELNR